MKPIEKQRITKYGNLLDAKVAFEMKQKEDREFEEALERVRNVGKPIKRESNDIE